jgi:hypothetical protein
VQEEKRIKTANGGTLSFVKDNKRKNANVNVNANSPSKPKGKGPMQHQPQQNKFAVNKDRCLYCEKEGHYKKDCLEFLKMTIALQMMPLVEAELVGEGARSGLPWDDIV